MDEHTLGSSALGIQVTPKYPVALYLEAFLNYNFQMMYDQRLNIFDQKLANILVTKFKISLLKRASKYNV